MAKAEGRMEDAPEREAPRARPRPRAGLRARALAAAALAALAPSAALVAALGAAGASPVLWAALLALAAVGAALPLLWLARQFAPLEALAAAFDRFAAPGGGRPPGLDELARIAAGVEALERRLEAATRLGDPARLDDPLTGLPNRLAVMRRARDEITRARRKAAALSVALVEIRRFDDIVAGCGRDQADLAVRLAAEQAVQALRAYDVVGRWEGASLVLLMPEAEIEHAVGAVRRIRDMIEEARIAVLDGAPASVIAGVAVLQPDDATLVDIVARAARALERARAGVGGGIEPAPGPRSRPGTIGVV
jgi:diguanylate cyclase (GGDEF)-like protein